MRTLFVTGAGGFLGHNVCRALKDRWRIAGTFLHSRPDCAEALRLDLNDSTALEMALDRVRPWGVLHLAALSSPNACELDPGASLAVNVQVPARLADICAARGIRLVFSSTDLVFGGGLAPYAEDDPPSPVNTYGRHKALAEAEVLARHPEALVCRMPLMFGECGQRPSFLQGFLKTVGEGGALRLFSDEFRTPVSGRDAALGLELALQCGLSGRLHLGGRERLSRLDLGLILQRILGSTVRIESCLQADVPMAAPRAADVSLDSRRAFALGYAPASVAEELARILAADAAR